MGMGPGGHMGGQGMMGPNGPGKHSSSLNSIQLRFKIASGKSIS